MPSQAANSGVFHATESRKKCHLQCGFRHVCLILFVAGQCWANMPLAAKIRRELILTDFIAASIDRRQLSASTTCSTGNSRDRARDNSRAYATFHAAVFVRTIRQFNERLAAWDWSTLCRSGGRSCRSSVDQGVEHHVPTVRIACRRRPGARPPSGCWTHRTACASRAIGSRTAPGSASSTPAAQPVIDKQPIAAWQDAEFAREAKIAVSRTFVAHVRYASTGAHTVAQHPPVHPGRPIVRAQRHFRSSGQVRRLAGRAGRRRSGRRPDRQRADVRADHRVRPAGRRRRRRPSPLR